MEIQIIKGTKYTPSVKLDPKGQIRIEGRSLIEDPFVFYEPIFTWIRGLNLEMLDIEVQLEYLNTSSTKQLFCLIHTAQCNSSIKDMHITWYYESDDEDTLELGKEIESLLDVPMNYYEITENVA